MSELQIYARTAAGNVELDTDNGKIAGDEKRVMLLVDGQSSVADIARKIPPSVRKKIGEIFPRLLGDRCIAVVGEVAGKHPGRIPT